MIFVIRQIVHSLFRHHFSAQLFCPVTPLLHDCRDILNLIHVSELDANTRDLQLIPKQDIPGETRSCPSACIHIHSYFYSGTQTLPTQRNKPLSMHMPSLVVRMFHPFATTFRVHPRNPLKSDGRSSLQSTE